MPAQLIPLTLPLPPSLPTIEGNVDYRHFRDQLLHIDQLLLRSGLEDQFIAHGAVLSGLLRISIGQS